VITAPLSVINLLANPTQEGISTYEGPTSSTSQEAPSIKPVMRATNGNTTQNGSNGVNGVNGVNGHHASSPSTGIKVSLRNSSRE
jgi:hypothetical protein